MKTNLIQLFRRTPSLILGGAVILALTAAAVDKQKENHPPAATVKVDEHPLIREGKFGASFAPVVKKASQSVVKVSTTTKGKNVSQKNMPSMNDPFRQFFGEDEQGNGRARQFRTPTQHGVGSGVIVSADGYILTNNHVVDDADELKVSLQDGREFTAKVVGKDPQSDVAVMKIDAKNLPAITIADSDKAEVGDVVLALGNPFGIGQTVTMGIVSALDRSSMGLDYEDFIQTDAAINPGNSGGALVDSEGRLVGINTAILSRSGGNQGIGFAIPANLAREVMESLISDGKVTRGYLGVMIQDLTASLAKEFKLEANNGALVGDVVPDSPAAKAGLKSGDVILEFHGKSVASSRALKFEVARTKPDQTVAVKILRDGSSKTLEVTPTVLPGQKDLAKAGSHSKTDTDTLNGVAVEDLDPATRKQLKLPAEIHGAVVTEVEPESPAAEAGLQRGDVITEINRHPVKTAEDAVKLTQNPKDRKTLLRVWNERGGHYLVVDESAGG